MGYDPVTGDDSFLRVLNILKINAAATVIDQNGSVTSRNGIDSRSTDATGEMEIEFLILKRDEESSPEYSHIIG